MRRGILFSVLTRAVVLLCGLLFAIGVRPVCADQASTIPDGYESYSVRPDIFKVTAQAHPELPSDWHSIKRGHVDALAMLFELYPDREFYFLARDAELLFDAAKIFAQDEPALLKRIHLLNVTRINGKDPHLVNYLAQEGISESTLRAGKKFLFIDTALRGSMPDLIRAQFPPEFGKQIQTQMMISTVSRNPSTRVFLSSINPAAPQLDPGSMEGSINIYEKMARYTDRSSQFVQVDGKWHPVSRIGYASNGAVSKPKAHVYMEDLVAYLKTYDAQSLFRERRVQWKKLHQSLKSGDRNQLVQELKSILAAKAGDPYPEAIVRDFVEALQTNLSASSIEPIKVQELGLREVTFISSRSNRKQLIEKYPQWASILEDPETGIPATIQKGEFGKLGAVIDAINDEEFSRALYRTLGKQSPNEDTRNFIRMMIAKKDPRNHGLAVFTFATPNVLEMREELKLFIEQRNPASLSRLASTVYSMPYSLPLRDTLETIIEMRIPEVLNDVALDVFSQPHSVQLEDLLQRFITVANSEALSNLASNAFSEPHTLQMLDSLKLLIEKADSDVLEELKYTLSKAPWNKPEYDYFREAIRIENSAKRRAFLKKHHRSKNVSQASCLKQAVKTLLLSPLK